MTRAIKIRVNYLSDANYLIRLSEAISRDPRRDIKWKQEAGEHLTALVSLFSHDAQQQLDSEADKKG